MELRILGCAGGSAPDQRLSSYLVDEAFAVDAGALTTALDKPAQRQIEVVALTHSHLDHIWTLPFFLANRFEQSTPTCHVHASAVTIDAVRSHLFNDRLWPDFTRMRVDGRPLVEWHVLDPGQRVRLLDRYEVSPIPLHHTVPCQAYRIERDGVSLIVCGDTITTEALWEVASADPILAGIVIECSWPDELLEVARTTAHMAPSLLAADLARLRKDVPVFVTHLKPGHEPAVRAALEALGDPRIRILAEGQQLAFASPAARRSAGDGAAGRGSG